MDNKIGKLVFKRLKSDAETTLFLDKVESVFGVRLPLLYARENKIVGVFLRNNLVACYMIVTGLEFRSLRFVPLEVRNEHSFFSKSRTDMMEVNALWIGPALKTPSMQFKVWMHLIKDIFFCGKKYVLLMRNMHTKSMERFNNMAVPQELYRGAPQLLSGENTHSEIQVAYTTRWRVVLNIPKYLLELVKRQNRAEEFARQRGKFREDKRRSPTRSLGG